MLNSANRILAIVEKKLDHGQRLTFDDGVALYEATDLPALATLANRQREARWGNATYYNINLHINPTNACVMNCKFCAFGRKLFDEKAYMRKAAEIVERARTLMPQGCTEIHLVGGLDPRLKLEFYCEYIRALKNAFPHVHIKTLTPVEVVYIAKLMKMTVRDTVAALREAGMDSMPGGGAEIFDPEVREQLCEHKCDAEGWFETHTAVHALGMKSNCTMLYGHIEQPRHRIDHMLRLREHQDRTGGFQCFIPLAFHPKNTDLDSLPGPTGVLDLKTIAIARLMLDNIPHIKAYWISLGLKTAQAAQWFGADDIDGTVTFEEIYHDAGATSPTGVKVADLLHVIREAGRTPVQRDSLYRPVDASADALPLAPATAY